MTTGRFLITLGLFVLLVGGCATPPQLLPMDAQSLYRMPAGVATRWASFENLMAAKGAGGTANKGAKGYAYDAVKPGESRVLMEAAGSGMITRIWITVSDRDPAMLRAMRLDMYWDGAETPAVSAPMGDFFGAVHGKTATLENALFSSPEGRSYNCYIPMPFRTGAKVVVTNESNRVQPMFFYDIDFVQIERLPADALYFHAHWRRERQTTLGRDFEILPKVAGQGRFLGAHLGVLVNPELSGWWGEGEVKMYLDDDAELPTLVGTGTEDYIGTGWGQAAFQNAYQGCTAADANVVAFYRYHVPDPVYFSQDIRVTIQQMGGASKQTVVEMLDRNAPVKPVAILSGVGQESVIPLMELPPDTDIRTLPDDWTNFYRVDDVCATAFFYLNSPVNGLPALQPVAERIEALPK